MYYINCRGFAKKQVAFANLNAGHGPADDMLYKPSRLDKGCAQLPINGEAFTGARCTVGTDEVLQLPWNRKDKGLVLFGRVWFGRLREVFGRRVGIGEGGGTGERGGVVQHFFPVVEFVGERKLLFYMGHGSEQDLAEVGEDGGFARGDAVLGDRSKEFAEDVVDVSGGEEIAVEGDGNFVAQALGLEELQFLPAWKAQKEEWTGLRNMRQQRPSEN
jgi:hypothetical protein